MIQSNTPKLRSVQQDKQAIEAQTQKLFQQILKDMLKSSRLSSEPNQYLQTHSQDQQQDNPVNVSNLSGQYQKNKLNQLMKRKLFEENKAKYQEMMLNAIRVRLIGMENELKELKEYKQQQQGKEKRENNQIVERVKGLMEQESNREQVLVEIAKVIGLGENVLEEYQEWKVEVASHRKIFTKYTTVMTEHHPFARENILQFLSQVNQEFQFNLQEQLQKLKFLQSQAEQNRQLSILKSFLIDQRKTNIQKLNHLYASGFFFKKTDSVSDEIIHMITVDKSVDVRRVYERLLNQKQEQLRKEHKIVADSLRDEMRRVIRLGMDRFKDMEKLYKGLLKMTDMLGQNDGNVETFEDLEEYYRKEIDRTEKIISHGTRRNNNTRKIYFKLIETEAK